jgi:predicted ArsR family transcriptional regulator
MRDPTAAIAALDDPLRHRIHEFVRSSGRAVNRLEVAAHAGISSKLAGFHLDLLEARGLLVSHYTRPPGRSGRGAGRSAKYYEPSNVEISVSVPERRYDLAGRLLVRAIDTQSRGESTADAARRVAKETGREIGADVRRELGLRRVGAERALSAASEALRRHGFEPYRSRPGEISLRNCPFHTLARQSPDLVCSMNREFIEGLVRGLGNSSVQAVLQPHDEDCCVKLRQPGAPAGP